MAGLVTYVEHYKMVFFQQSLLLFNQHTMALSNHQHKDPTASQLTEQLSQHSSIWAFNGAFALLSISLLLMATLFLALYLFGRKRSSLSLSPQLSLAQARTGNS